MTGTACAAGVATTIKSLSKDSLAAKGLLRHSSVSTTERHYIKDVPENTLSAMNELEKLFTVFSVGENSARPLRAPHTWSAQIGFEFLDGRGCV